MNTELLFDLTGLADNELLAQVKHLARSERETTVRLVAHLAELDARKLYLGEACASLFTYCVEVLHFSEHAAYGRIQAARAARKFPVVLERLASGSLNLTTLGLLAPHLTPENHVRLLAAADCKSKREVEVIVATIRPRPDVAAMIRRVPQARAGAGTAVVKVLSATPASLAELNPEVPAPAGAPAPARLERYKIQFTASAATHAKLRLAQELLRHQIPNGDPAQIIDRALSLLVAELEKRKFAKLSEKKTRRPEGAARPAAGRAADLSAHVRSQVWARDGGRCAYASPEGRRCGAGGLLEFYRLQPHNDGLPTADNIELRCGAHAGDEHSLDLASAIQQCGRHGDGILCESAAAYRTATGSGPSWDDRRRRSAASRRCPRHLGHDEGDARAGALPFRTPAD